MATLPKESTRSAIAQTKPRDKDGHFIKAGEQVPALETESKENPAKAFIAEHTNVFSTRDDKTLIDLHVGNPLHRITQLLEEIKKQKAFSFTLKGSLGIMGVFLGLSVFGLFGTTHALCDKGTQTHVGIVKVLQMTQAPDKSFVTKVTDTIDYYKRLLTMQPTPKDRQAPRVILVTLEYGAIHLAESSVLLKSFAGQTVYATGQYDACTQTLQIKDKTHVEIL